MNTDDYAIVIGINRYPRLGPPSPGGPLNLDGPVVDATAMRDWLIDPAKGGVPEENVAFVTSAAFPDPFETVNVGGIQRTKAEPTVDHLRGCVEWILERHVQSGKLQLGRRLYVYFSGHGFCVRDCDGGVFLANATPDLVEHFYSSSWFEGLYNKAIFSEYVLWVDACSSPIPMNLQPSESTLAGQVNNLDDGRRFVAFSAKFPRKSVERRMPDDQIRGVFSYALLEGLNGAALDEQTGRLTGANLRDYLKNTLKEFLPQQDQNNPDIGDEPAFGTIDDIEFGQFAAKTFQRKISFEPRHNGMRARIKDGQSTVVLETDAGADLWVVDLMPGLHKVEVEPDTELFLEINGENSDEIRIA
ncbi:caspase family protein [uncultured Ruegeria sp.]|uniref:caspase family protein n=1 Tax=uncultured Ruegeria sp. TaxID=259304 RepID=UPI0026385F6B|nr:caspase family protein [uncultured Ruegeria sp.]